MGSPPGSVYLSGWEYNRLLQHSAIAPRTSALPAASLWRGAHQFWLFRNVLCTAESLENECDAADALGWATGAIFRELVSEGIVQSVDWSHLPTDVTARLEATLTMLRAEYPEDEVRRLIGQGDVAALEAIKNRLLKPVLDHFGARASGAPNSLGTWLGTGVSPGSSSVELSDTEDVLLRLAAPVLPGVAACSPPGTGLPAKIVEQQKAVQRTVEAPLIAALVAGDGPFEGGRGHLPFLEELRPHRSAYGSINEQILRDWRSNRDRLYRTRDLAEAKLWEPLHGEWLPALDSGEMKVSTFEKRIELAVKAGPILRALDTKPVRTLVGVLPAVAGSVVTLGTAAGVAELGADPVVAGASGTAAAALVEAMRLGLAPRTHGLRTSTRLAVFYQQGQ